jgi:tyrosyl-tRNA synthetase
MEELTIAEKIELITRNLEEVIGKEELENKIKEKGTITVYWGTAPTGKPHVGYMFPMSKVRDLLNAGCKVKILLADIHAALDNTPWNILEYRYQYYSKIIPLLINAMGGDITKLEFVKGSDIQLSKEYTLDMYKMSSITTIHDSNKAASEVVKMSDNPKVSGLIYPLMQALDEEYLKVDAQLGGTDQRKIMVLAREKLPQIGYEKRIELINPLVPGLIGKKMSASVAASKLELTDEPETVEKKIKGAEFEEGNTDNGVMAILKYIVFTTKQDNNEKLIIERPEKWGGNLEFANYPELEKAVIEKNLHPLDVKKALAKEISKLLEPIIKYKNEIEEIEKLAYPEN